jgi:hypothetical protein
MLKNSLWRYAKNSLWRYAKQLWSGFTWFLSFVSFCILLAMGFYLLYLFAANPQLAALYLGSGGALASLVSLFAPIVGQVALRAAHYTALIVSKATCWSSPKASQETTSDQQTDQQKKIQQNLLRLLHDVNHDPITRGVIAFYAQVTAVFSSLFVIIVISVLNLYLNIDKVGTLFGVTLSLSTLSINTILYGITALVLGAAIGGIVAGNPITPYIKTISDTGFPALLSLFPPFMSWFTPARFFLIILGGVFAYVTVSGS